MLAKSALDKYLDRRAVEYIEQALEFLTRLVLNILFFHFHWACGLKKKS